MFITFLEFASLEFSIAQVLQHGPPEDKRRNKAHPEKEKGKYSHQDELDRLRPRKLLSGKKMPDHIDSQ